MSPNLLLFSALYKWKRIGLAFFPHLSLSPVIPGCVCSFILPYLKQASFYQASPQTVSVLVCFLPFLTWSEQEVKSFSSFYPLLVFNLLICIYSIACPFTPSPLVYPEDSCIILLTQSILVIKMAHNDFFLWTVNNKNILYYNVLQQRSAPDPKLYCPQWKVGVAHFGS